MWPWLQILDDLDRSRPLPDELRALVSGAQDTVSAADADPGGAKFKQHESVRRYLGEVAQSQPLMIALDDIQWADVATVQLLADVFTVTRTGRILAVATTRETDEGNVSRTQALVRLDRANGVRLVLSGLEVSAIEEMVAAAGNDESGQQLLKRTGGNPLFVREHLRLSQRSADGQDQSRVPDSVGDLIRQRLSILPAQTQSALQAASVLGSDFDVDGVVAVSAQSEEEVWEAMDGGLLAGILAEGRAGDWRFRHDLVRETLYADLAPSRRARLHSRALAMLNRRPLADVSELAEHAHAAGPAGRREATHWSIAAAEQASKRLAYEDAARWWTRALDAQERDSDAESASRVDLLMALLRAQLDAGDAIGGRDTRNHAVLATAEFDDDAATARALVALDAPALWLLRQFDEVEFGIVWRLEATLSRLPAVDDDLRCRVLATLAMELYDAEPDRRCDELSREAVDMARRLGDPAVLVFALNARYLAMNREIIPEESIDSGHELVAIGDAHGWAAVSLLGHLVLASSLLYHGDLTAADEHADLAERLNRRLHLPLPRMQALGYRLARLQLDGRFEESAALIEEFSELRLSWWAFDGLLAAMHLTQLFLSDALDKVTEPILAAASLARPTLAHDCRILIAAQSGEAPEAQLDWSPPARDWGWMAMSLVRAEAVSVAGDDSIRQQTYHALAPYTGKIAYSSGFAAPVDWYLARLSHSLGDEVATKRHLDTLYAACVRESLDWWAERALKAGLAAS